MYNASVESVQPDTCCTSGHAGCEIGAGEDIRNCIRIVAGVKNISRENWRCKSLERKGQSAFDFCNMQDCIE